MRTVSILFSHLEEKSRKATMLLQCYTYASETLQQAGEDGHLAYVRAVQREN